MSIGCKINLNYERPDWALVEALKEFPVANIDDCMNRTAAIHSSIRPLNKTRLAGIAFTVRVPETTCFSTRRWIWCSPVMW